MPIERTLFFVKPYIDLATASEILAYRDALLARRTQFKAVASFTTQAMSLKFWQDFYSQIEAKHPTPFRLMCNDFASCSGIVGDVLEGEDILRITREIMGANRIIGSNSQNTVRGRFDHYRNEGKEWRNCTHASTTDEVAKDLAIFTKYGIVRL